MKTCRTQNPCFPVIQTRQGDRILVKKKIIQFLEKKNDEIKKKLFLVELKIICRRASAKQQIATNTTIKRYKL